MTAYIVRKGAQKKKGILEKREEELIHSINADSPSDQLEKAAEKVRSAHLAVIKCLFHESEPVRTEDEERFGETRTHLERRSEYWASVSVGEIIARYSTPHRQTATNHAPDLTADSTAYGPDNG